MTCGSSTTTATSTRGLSSPSGEPPRQRRDALSETFHIQGPRIGAEAARTAGGRGVGSRGVRGYGDGSNQGAPQPPPEAAVEGRGHSDTKILAVTFLTSLNREDLDQNLIKPGEIQTLASSRAEKAILAGADGVIASSKELPMIRANPLCMTKIIVTPGIRPTNSAINDQKRVSTPSEALKMGASYLVIGRPICQANDPLEAYKKIKKEILHT